jgi:hypothetical protein
MRAALERLHGEYTNGGLPAVVLPEDLRRSLSRQERVEETADLLRELAG